MGQVSPEERPALGAAVNQAKGAVETAISSRMAEFRSAQMAAALAEETIDISLPGTSLPRGSRHIL